MACRGARPSPSARKTSPPRRSAGRAPEVGGTPSSVPPVGSSGFRRVFRKVGDAEGAEAFADAVIERDDDDVLRHQGSGRKSARHVERIECPDRLHGKGLACPREDLVVQAHSIPSRARGRKVCSPLRGSTFADLAESHSAMENAVTFDEGELRGEDDVRSGENLTDSVSGRFSEKPGEDRARFSVEVQCSPRSASRSSRPLPGGSRGSRWG